MIAIEILEQQAIAAINNASDLSSLEAIRVGYLGKKGKLTSLLKQLGSLSTEERPKSGALINQAKRLISASIETKQQQLTVVLLKQKLASETLDITLPGRNNTTGSLHPVSQVRTIVLDYFTKLGFDTIFGPEIEEDYYNFEALNIPVHHPARAMHDTFYFNDHQLLRTHTSPVQIRFMEQYRPPLRVVAPGRVYRCDSDLTHTPMFHQIEGLCIDKHITLGHLKGLLEDFFNHFFGKSLKIRFRPSYFPFTEPSIEADIECVQCSNQGCRLCKLTGWLEVLGCGMVHPSVLKAVNISSEDYQGWAFGMGMDRLAMLYFGIEDLRTMFENDKAFLQQF